MKKIVIISLADDFGSKTSEVVANDIGMFFLKLDDYVDYNLYDSEEVLLRCGIEYFKKQEKKILCTAFEFINTLYYCSYNLFINNREIFSKFECEYVYIALTLDQLNELKEKSLSINSIAFQDRDVFLKSIGLIIEGSILVKKSFANKIVQKLKNSIDDKK